MSKTIEFVDKSIKKQTEKLEELKRQKKHYEILHNSTSIISYTPQIVSIDLEIANIEFNLEHIKQIKLELEAWEVVKRYTDTSEDIVNTEYYFIKGLDDEFETLNKALEVEDE